MGGQILLYIMITDGIGCVMVRHLMVTLLGGLQARELTNNLR